MPADTLVSDVEAALGEIAPWRYAADWDNVGLLLGRRDWPARNALLAIDLTDAVAREALRRRATTLIVYHPPIFKGVRTLTDRTDGPTALLPDLLAARIAVFSLHTALDAAPGGTNDAIIDCFDVLDRRPLEPIINDGDLLKLVVFVPPAEVEKLRSALSRAGAGVIGNYEECSFEVAGRGSFRGNQASNPVIGKRQQLEFVQESSLEMVLRRRDIGAVVRALYSAHSYDEPAFDIYPLITAAGRGAAGLGRAGTLRRPARGSDLLRRLRGRYELSGATVVGDLRRRFTTITAAAGSFGASAFRDADSLVITGELKHHDALSVLRCGVTAVCLGHYASERPVLDRVAAQLKSRLPRLRIAVAASDCPPLSPCGTS